MRLDRFLSIHGLSSRKAAKKIVKEGRIQVDGNIVHDYTIDIKSGQEIRFDGDVIENLPFVTLIMNKPEGYISSMIDEKYPSIMRLVPERFRKRVRIVGRLDNDTTGLLIFTDNGVLNSRLANPRYAIQKTYEVEVNHILTRDLVEKMKNPLDIGRGEIAHVDKLEIVDEYHAFITIHEGKYHEVKRIFGKFSYDVIKLKRVSFGPLSLGALPLGESRLLNEDEYQMLLSSVRMTMGEEE